MTRYKESLLPVVLLLFFQLLPAAASGQIDKLVIPAGTPEDHDLQEISDQQDAAKKLAMYQDFVQKYAANPAAVAYGNWEISQAYQTSGDLKQALDYGDKALAGAPRNLDILVSQASIAQQAKDNARLMDYAAKGGDVCNSVGKQAKPDGVSEEEFKQRVANETSAAQSNCDFLESVGFNVITGENDAKSRMADIEKYTAAFPNSKFQDQVASYAMYSLGQLNDQTRLVAYGEKTLAANPNSLAALLLLANFYGDDTKPGSAGKAISYAQKAIEVAKPDAPDADKSSKLSGGVAHTIVGYTYAFKQDKTSAAIPELKTAAALLKGQDDQQYARALYGLGYAYGKLNKLTEARDVLTEAVKISSPWQKVSQDLLAKVNAARAKGK